MVSSDVAGHEPSASLLSQKELPDHHPLAAARRLAQARMRLASALASLAPTPGQQNRLQGTPGLPEVTLPIAIVEI